MELLLIITGILFTLDIARKRGFLVMAYNKIMLFDTSRLSNFPCRYFIVNIKVVFLERTFFRRTIFKSCSLTSLDATYIQPFFF